MYEHQSTYSPNLPLRFLFYISNLYSGMTKDENLYGTRKVPIPTPEFVIFLAELVQKKIGKGKTVEQIAEELEETTSVIEKLIKSM